MYKRLYLCPLWFCQLLCSENEGSGCAALRESASAHVASSINSESIQSFGEKQRSSWTGVLNFCLLTFNTRVLMSGSEERDLLTVRVRWAPAKGLHGKCCNEEQGAGWALLPPGAQGWTGPPLGRGCRDVLCTRVTSLLLALLL